MTDGLSSYYEQKRGELQAVLFQVSPSLRPDTYQFVMEMLDSNELGVSLEVIVETLAEAGLPITIGVLDDLSRLADEMEMNYDVVGPLARLVNK